MLKTNRTLPALAFALLPLGLMAAESDVESVLAEAASLHQQALALEHGWSVTEPLMEEARAALAAGDSERAEEIARRARLTAEQAVEQARREQTAWRERALDS